MGEQPPADRPGANGAPHGESMAWAAISTLVAGPATWGGIGWLVDHWLGTGRVFTASGVVVGFIASVYIVITKYGQ